MGFDLEGRRALVTGGSKGLGREICAALIEAGAQVTGVARASSSLDNAAQQFGSAFEPWPFDATGTDLLTAIEKSPAFDILVNNAGTNRPQPFAEVTDEALEMLIDLNIRSVFKISRAVVRKMRPGASICHVTSQMGHVGSPNRTAYCMTKHAIEGLSKAMAVELAPAGIRVNCVAPTFVRTPLTSEMLDDPEFAGFVQRMIPMGELATAEQVALAVVYLSSSAAEMITGHSLLIDGGWTAQ